MSYLGRLKSWLKAKIKRITATTSKMAIAVLSAVIISFVVSVSVFKSVRFFSWEHPGILIVVLAVAGEVICDWNRKKSLKERLKKFFGILLLSGLLLEIAEAVKSDKKASVAYLEAKLAETNSAASYERAAVAEREAAQASERAANTESNNLVLQSKVLDLEDKTKDRIITQAKKELFIKFLKSTSTGIVKLGGRNMTSEALIFADEIRDMLTNANYTVSSYIDYKDVPFVPFPLPEGRKIWLFFSQADKPPYFFLRSQRPFSLLESIRLLPPIPTHKLQISIPMRF